jgi:hypothetical protein
LDIIAPGIILEGLPRAEIGFAPLFTNVLDAVSLLCVCANFVIAHPPTPDVAPAKTFDFFEAQRFR